MKLICASFRKHAKNINDFEKKKMLLLTKEELKSYQDAKYVIFMEKRILKKLSKSISCWKVRDHCHYTGKYIDAIHSICNLKFHLHNDIPVVFHDSSNYGYHFIIKELSSKFEGQFQCLGENTDKCKSFFVQIEKEVTKRDKDVNESVVTIS